METLTFLLSSKGSATCLESSDLLVPTYVSCVPTTSQVYQPRPKTHSLPAQNMLSVMRIRVEALHTGRSTMGRFTTCRTLGCISLMLVVHVSRRLPQPVTLPLYPAWSKL